MAVCPCGCNRKLGLMKRGIGTKVRDMDPYLQVLENANSLLQSTPAESSSVSASDRAQLDADLGRLLDDGRTIRGIMVRLCHGERVPSAAVPSPSEYNAWMTNANAFVAELR